MVYHSLKRFGELKPVTKIIVATQRSYFDFFTQEKLTAAGITVPVVVVQGGKERVDSVARALREVKGDAAYVMIHDAARPFISRHDILNVLRKAQKKRAALLVRAVVPTVKKISRQGAVVETIDRGILRHAETPQVFETTLLKKAYAQYKKRIINGPATDDASLVEQLGVPVWTVTAQDVNIKITNSDDLAVAQKKGTGMNIRVGIGYDIHRLLHGEPLCLGGIKVDFEKGCIGHSDGDPVIHAIIDALLGTVGTKDIGEYFRDDNPRFKKIASLELLGKVRQILKKKKCRIINIDTVIVCEKPRIAPLKKDMIRVLAKTLEIEEAQVSIKGKTKEGLDAEGGLFAISAQTVALVEIE